MALQFMDGFDHYTLANLLQKGWTSLIGSVSTINFVTGASTPYNTGQACEMTGGNGFGVAIYKTLATNYATLFTGFNFRTISSATSESIYAFQDAGNYQLWVVFNTSGQVIIKNSSGTVLATSTATNLIQTNIWCFLEVGAKFSTTVGWCEVRVNGVLQVAYYGSTGTSRGTANGNTAAGSGVNQANRIQLGSYNLRQSGDALDYDDFYVVDSSGAANNDFLGPVRVQTLYPIGAGNYAQWTPDTGLNFARVNETTGNGDTSYVSTATLNNIDSYTFGDLATPTQNVKGVQFNVTMRSDDAGSHTIAPVQRSSGADSLGNTSAPVGASYTDVTDIHDTSLATGVAYTVSEVNAAEFGVKLIS